MRVILYLFDTLRYPVAICVVIGLAGVLVANGAAGLGKVLWLIAMGILMNGAALLVVLWAYRTWRARRSNGGDI